MKKNLLNKKAAEDTIARIQLLQPNATAKWGTMTVTEMLHHCYMANKNILEGKPDHKTPSLKQRFMKTLFLYFIPRLPKYIKGPARIDPKLSTIAAEQFEEKKTALIKTIHQFPARNTPLEITHPFFGKLKTKEWGIASWMHLDHHLRQFSV